MVWGGTGIPDTNYRRERLTRSEMKSSRCTYIYQIPVPLKQIMVTLQYLRYSVAQRKIFRTVTKKVHKLSIKPHMCFPR